MPVHLFLVAAVALVAAHEVADHWIQTEHQAVTKGLPGWVGRRACLAHVATYTVVGLVALSVPVLLFGLVVQPLQLAAGLGVSAVTHYVADRRAPLRALAALAGHAGFFAMGAPRPGRDDNPCLGTGGYAMDQSWHKIWLFVSALVIAVP